MPPEDIRPDVRQPAMKKPAPVEKEQKVVILHTVVGQFTRGSVVPASTFGELARLLNINAVRIATDDEAKLELVDLDAANATPRGLIADMQARLDNKQAMIDQLEREVQTLRSIQQTAAASTTANTVNELMVRMKENEKTILALQNQLAEANKKLADVKGQ